MMLLGQHIKHVLAKANLSEYPELGEIIGAIARKGKCSSCIGSQTKYKLYQMMMENKKIRDLFKAVLGKNEFMIYCSKNPKDKRDLYMVKCSQ